MNTQSATQGKADQNCGETEPGAKTGAGPLPVPSRTRRLFFHFEIGFKKTSSHVDRRADALQLHEAPVAQPVLAFSAGAPKPPAPAPEILAALPGNPPPPAGSGSGTSTSTAGAYVNLSVGETVTPPDPGGGGYVPP